MEKSSSWLVGKLRKGQIWCALLALSLSLSVASAGEFRSSLFYLALGVSFLAVHLALCIVNGWVDSGLASEVSEREKAGILLLSQLGLALFALHGIAGEAVPLALRSLIHLGCGLLLVSLGIKRWVSAQLKSAKEWVVIWSLLTDNQLMVACLFVPAAVIGVAGLITGRAHPFLGLSVWVAFSLYLAALTVLFGVWILVAKRVAARTQGSRALALYDLNRTAVVAAAPLILIPLGVQIAGELQFSFPSLGLRSWGVLVIAILVMSSVILATLQRRGRIVIDRANVLSWFYFPAAVASLASLKTHRLSLDLGRLDYLLVGQQTLPAQQWSEFGTLPLLDLLPSHGFADFGFQSLFTLFNGLRGLDMMVWLPWVPIVAGFVAIYAFLALVTSPVLALLVTILMPVEAVVVGPYAMVLLPAIALVPVLRRPSFRRFFMLWMVSAALLAWRPRVGGPAALALVIVVVLVILIEKREVWAAAMGSLALVLGLVPAILLLGEIVGGGDTYTALTHFLGLLGSPQSGDLGAIELGAGSHGLAALLQEVLPIVAVAALLYFCLREVLSPGTFGASSHAVVFVAVFSLVQTTHLDIQTGERLSIDPSLLLLTLALLPFLVVDGAFRIRQVGRSTWLLATLVGCALLGSDGLYNLVGGGVDHGRLHAWRPDDQRVEFHQQPHRDLVEYLRGELGAEESFLDFTGSTALYALAGKRYPLPNLTDFRTTSESIQRTQAELLESQRVEGRLPLVIFRAPPGFALDRGALPTESISYRIAEFIYASYFPFARIAGWEIWREKGSRRGEPVAPAKLIGPKAIRQDFELGMSPRQWAEEDPRGSLEQPAVAALLGRPTVVRSQMPLRLQWDSEVAVEAATYLHIRARSLRGPRVADGAGRNAQPRLTVFYGDEPQSTFNFVLATASTPDLESGQTVALDLQETFKKNLLRRVSMYPDRWVFRPTGKDPWLRRFLDLSGVPPLEAGTEQWLKLRYRSTEAGRAQLFFVVKDNQFLERLSVRVDLVATSLEGAAAEIVVPTLGLQAGDRLTDLRIDPPTGSDFEIVGVELTQLSLDGDDYLTRLKTQFQWATGRPTSLTLKSNSPVIIESVVLRTGD